MWPLPFEIDLRIIEKSFRHENDFIDVPTINEKSIVAPIRDNAMHFLSSIVSFRKYLIS